MDSEGLCFAIPESEMVTGVVSSAASSTKANKRPYSVIRPTAAGLLCLGSIIGISSMVFWPISSIEKWHADRLIAAMLAAAFGLITAGCHCLDVDEARRRNSRR